MTASNFLACFNETASMEGGYVDNPHDPGGATMAGVTQAVYAAWLAKQGRPNAPVKEISLSDRQAIYRELYWNAVRGDDLYAGLDLVVVDTGWGSGPVTAIKLLQRALGVADDGKLGPATLAAVQSQHNSVALIDKVCAERMTFFRGLSTWEYFGVGWTSRLNRIQAKALAMNAVALKGSPMVAGLPQSGATPIVSPSLVPGLPQAGATPIAATQPALSPREQLDKIQHHLDDLTPTPAHVGMFAEIWAAIRKFGHKLDEM